MAAGLVTEELLQKVTNFHGHLCPGLAIGIRAAEIALREVGPHARDEEVVAVVETDMCGVDAIQFLTGCTFGKGNLIHKDYGKNAFSFYRRSDGKGVRIVASPEALSSSDPEREQLLTRMRQGALSPAEEKRFAEMQKALTERILRAPLDTLFTIHQAPADIPRRARIHGSQICDACGEAVMATRVRQQGGRMFCIPCSEKLSQD